jgi:hypothetical protein
MSFLLRLSIRVKKLAPKGKEPISWITAKWEFRRPRLSHRTGAATGLLDNHCRHEGGTGFEIMSMESFERLSTEGSEKVRAMLKEGGPDSE